MEALSASMAAVLATRYLVPAIKEFGARILDTAESRAGDSVVDFGRRILHTLIRGPGSEDMPVESAILGSVVERRVVALSADPSRKEDVARLEGAIEDLLLAVPSLLCAVAELLEGAPQVTIQQAARSSYIGGDNSGAVVTGDGNIVTGRDSP